MSPAPYSMLSETPVHAEICEDYTCAYTHLHVTMSSWLHDIASITQHNQKCSFVMSDPFLSEENVLWLR